MLIAKVNDTPTRLELRKEQLRLLTPTSTCKPGFKSKYTVGQATALHADVSKPADACWQLEQMSFTSKHLSIPFFCYRCLEQRPFKHRGTESSVETRFH